MTERTTLRRLLRQPSYRRLRIARAVSQWGDAFNTVALALLVYSLTGSGIGVAGVVLAEILPVLALAPVAGAIIDRLPRVKVMIGADSVRAALAFALPFVDGNVAAVYAVAVGLSAGRCSLTRPRSRSCRRSCVSGSWSPRTAGCGPRQ